MDLEPHLAILLRSRMGRIGKMGGGKRRFGLEVGDGGCKEQGALQEECSENDQELHFGKMLVVEI